MKNSTLFIILAFIIHINASSQQCLPNGIVFSQQNQINNFQTNFPNCTEIIGNVEIESSGNITSLSGLSVLNSIGGDLNITNNSALISLYGLNNLTFIGGDLDIIRNDLERLTGLNSLISIGGDLSILYNDFLTNLSGFTNLTSIGDSLELSSNSYTNLSGLENLTSIGGGLIIRNHSYLTSLIGLDNIDYNSISNLLITTNIVLTTCEIQSVCDYIASPGAIVGIGMNETGCNNPTEVLDACATVWVSSSDAESDLSIYPNPAKNELFILRKNIATTVEINIYNQLGQKVLHNNGLINKFDISMLGQGIYIVELISDNFMLRKKLVIKR